jgi:iojap-like protein
MSVKVEIQLRKIVAYTVDKSEKRMFVKQIIVERIDMETTDLAKKIMAILEEKKAADILALDISEISTLADYFILASAENVRQLDALEDAVEEGIRLELNKEGEGDSGWILMDYKDIVVHLFTKEQREFYDLEKIWSDAKKPEI